MDKTVIIRSGETVLKGKNKRFFEDKLLKSIHRVLKPLGYTTIEKKHNRFYVPVKEEDASSIINALRMVFGIDLISIASITSADLHSVRQLALNELKQAISESTVTSFKVQTKRSDKSFPMDSQKISHEVGGFLLSQLPGIKVDVHRPDITIYVEIKERAYVFSDRIRGLGGLPSETNGKALLLLSGGIDSPVSGWMTARRGVEIKALHFHSYPFTSHQAVDKVKKLTGVLSGYCGPIDFHSVNLLSFQQAIAEICPEEQGTILARRMMTRVGELIAFETGCDALITGESLGQVASQTIQSLRVTNECVNLPIIRPLIAMDKRDIIEIARKIGTYEISIQPYEDCCTIFLPEKPVTKPRIQDILKSESLVNMEESVKKLMETIEKDRIKKPIQLSV